MRLAELAVVVVHEAAKNPEVAAGLRGVNKVDLRFRVRDVLLRRYPVTAPYRQRAEPQVHVAGEERIVCATGELPAQLADLPRTGQVAGVRAGGCQMPAHLGRKRRGVLGKRQVECAFQLFAALAQTIATKVHSAHGQASPRFEQSIGQAADDGQRLLGSPLAFALVPQTQRE